MQKLTKKLGVAVLALVAAMALSSVAFADPTTLTNGVAGDKDPANALDKAVQIEKELVVYNLDETTIAEPNITYTYTLTAGAAGKQITDTDSVTALTKAGILPATTTATVVYNNSDITAADNGASNIKTFSFDFSGVNYDAAGVYRYVITETTNVDKAAAGITDGTISNVRYLDVYVRDAREGETGRQIYGYVLFAANNDIDGTDASTPTSVALADKTTGFVASDEGATGTTNTADQYYTFNETVSKTLVNDSAMNSHQFPFNVDFTNAAVTQPVLLKQTVSGTATGTTQSAAAVSSLDCAPTIANGGSVKYIGIPVGTSIDVYETNNVTGTTYKSKYSIDGATAAGEKQIAWNVVSNTATLTAPAVDTDDNTAHTIAFTNTMELISPTGIVMRYGPFGFMLAAGIALLFVATRRREEDARA